MNFIDRSTIADSTLRKTSDGYIVAEVPVARTGMQDYLGSEMGKPEMDRVRVYRPAEEVFADAHLISICHKPVTNDHPGNAVTPDTWKRDAVGYMGESIRKDEAAGLIHVPLLFADAGAISDLERGKREVSMGYTCDIDWTPGVTADGKEYDAVQRNIKANHVALVTKGRAGYSCRVSDNWTPMNETTDDKPNKEPLVALKTVQIQSVADGMPFEATDAAETIIRKLVADRETAQEATAKAERDLNDAKADHDTAIVAKDAEIVKLTADLKAAAVTPEQMLDAAKAYADTITKAKALGVETTDAMTAADAMKAAVTLKMGDKASDYDEGKIAVAFTVLSADAAPVTDDFREVVRDGVVNTNDADKAADAARQAYMDRLFNVKADA